MGHLLILGLGYTGQRLARKMLSLGWQVSGTNRSGRIPDGLEQIAVHPFSRQSSLPDQALKGVSHILSSIPPDDLGDLAAQMLGPRLKTNPPSWLGYLSTTGVYGDHGGAWVTEATPPTPQALRSDRRLRAEQEWQSLNLGCHLFRLPGIYGPGRSALDQIRSNAAKRIDKPGHVFCRIHVDDIVSALMASFASPSPGEIFNLADDLPAPNRDVIEEAARLLNKPAPPLISWDDAQKTLSPMAQSFWADCKRVSSEKFRQATGWHPAFPTYKEGLRHIIDAP